MNPSKLDNRPFLGRAAYTAFSNPRRFAFWAEAGQWSEGMKEKHLEE
jgi:hypothetical protein